ncbi:MAG TPA: diguanylate cyclase [Anaerolinea sp.]|nr:diguanylate cyclase [Anaerolinea sp.]
MFGLFSLVSLIFGSAAVSFFVFSIENDIWKERRSDIALNAATAIENYIRRELDLVTFTALNMRGPQDQDNAALDLLFKSEPVFYELAQVDSTGELLHVVAGANENLTSTFSVRQSNWFQKLKQTNSYIGTVEYSSSDEPYVILAISAPSGRIIVARVNMKVISNVVSNFRLGSTGQVYIVDRDGYLLAHPDSDLMRTYANISESQIQSGALSFDGSTWSGVYRNLRGSRVTGVAVRMEFTNWIVFAEVNNSEIHQFSRIAWIIQIVMVGLFAVAATLAARRYMNLHVFHPLKALREGAEEIQSGNLNAPVPIMWQDEIGAVALSFNQMAASLSIHQKNLEQQSEELRKEIAEREIAQQALERLNIELEERVGLRTIELSKVNNLLQESETKFHSLVESIPAVVYLAELRPEGPLLTYVSPQIGDLLGFSPAEWMEEGRWISQIDPNDFPMVNEYYEQMYLSADRYALEYRLTTTREKTVWIKDQGIVKEYPTTGRFIMGVMSDITMERADKAYLVHLSMHDPLTSLPNRNLLTERLGHLMRRARRHPEIKYAVLYLDMDGFKQVNDSFGHASGDQVLIETAERIQSMVRDLDTVARFGGDEFVVLIEDPKDEEAILHLMDRIRDEIKKPYTIGESQVMLSVSIGMSCCQEKFTNPSELINAADLSMYREKMSNKSRNIVSYDSPASP